MAKFHFPLATLRKLREAHRDEMRSKLAEAYQAAQLLTEQIAMIESEATSLQQAQRARLQSTTANVNQLLDSQRYQAVLQAQITTMTNQSQILAEEVEKRRQALVEADQQVRVLEKLYERKLDAHRKHERLAEAKVLDEIGSRPQENNLLWAP